MNRVLPLAMLCALGLGACAVTTTTAPPAPPFPPIPAARAEIVPKPPVSEQPLIWQPGHWEWTGAAYAWTPGTWVERAGHGPLWQDGYWAQTATGYVWVPGHWTGS